jgi:hypothetical protein
MLVEGMGCGVLSAGSQLSPLKSATPSAVRASAGDAKNSMTIEDEDNEKKKKGKRKRPTCQNVA